jgi:hypothetical protein
MVGVAFTDRTKLPTEGTRRFFHAPYQRLIRQKFSNRQRSAFTC